MPQSKSAPKTKPSANWFPALAKWTAQAAGRPGTFSLAAVVILVWAVTGPVFHYSDTWQLVINTGTTIVTFLMVFLIQSTQNRDSQAIHVKLDELICAMKGAKNTMLDLDHLSDDELAKLREHYVRLAAKAQKELDSNGSRSRLPRSTRK